MTRRTRPFFEEAAEILANREKEIAAVEEKCKRLLHDSWIKYRIDEGGPSAYADQLFPADPSWSLDKAEFYARVNKCKRGSLKGWTQLEHNLGHRILQVM